MRTFITFLLLITSTLLTAQVTWNFGTATPNGGILANSTVSDVTRGNNNGTTTLITTTSASTGYAGASGTGNAGAACFVAPLSTATSTYFEVTITPASGYQVSISNIALGNRSTTTGPQLISVRSSLDAYATDLTTASVANNSAWALAGFGAFTLTTGAVNQPITLRIYGSAGTGTPSINTANWRIDDLAITYAVTVTPITLKSFYSTYKNGSVLLKWITSQESNMKMYTVEKSIDGINFISIGSTNAKNSTENSYEFTDANITKSSFYYRLKIEDINGKVTYSYILRVDNLAPKGTVQIYPTVTSSNFSVKLTSTSTNLVSIQIIDAAGKFVAQQNYPVSSGINNLPVYISHLSKGIYQVKIIGSGINETGRIIKH